MENAVKIGEWAKVPVDWDIDGGAIYKVGYVTQILLGTGDSGERAQLARVFIPEYGEEEQELLSELIPAEDERTVNERELDVLIDMAIATNDRPSFALYSSMKKHVKGGREFTFQSEAVAK